MPMCPIVLACGTATYNTAKFITKIIQNYCGKMSSYVTDSTDFFQKIKHLSINPEEETLVLFDVSTLFTCCTTSYQLQNFYLQPVSPTSVRSLQKIHQASGIHYHQLHLLLQ